MYGTTMATNGKKVAELGTKQSKDDVNDQRRHDGGFLGIESRTSTQQYTTSTASGIQISIPSLRHSVLVPSSSNGHHRHQFGSNMRELKKSSVSAGSNGTTTKDATGSSSSTPIQKQKVGTEEAVGGGAAGAASVTAGMSASASHNINGHVSGKGGGGAPSSSSSSPSLKPATTTPVPSAATTEANSSSWLAVSSASSEPSTTKHDEKISTNLVAAIKNETTTTTAAASTTTTTNTDGVDNNNKKTETATDKPEGDEKTSSSSSPVTSSAFGTGCLSCGDDDDHANLLLCEGCNAEYHTYCLDPPLRSVPMGDWYCPKCVKDSTIWTADDDGLERMVCALSPTFTERFGEVCWAYGGAGFGWWPSIIYDPRSVVGGARELAKKQLGKRHLVYFFECFDAPWTVLTSSKITDWEKGLQDDLHLGKPAKSAGKNRHEMFTRALQAATLEYAKPIELRMDWNHTEQPQVLPTPKKRQQKKKVGQQKKRPRTEIDGDDPNGGTTSDSSSGRGDKKRKKKIKIKKKKRKERKTRGFPLFGMDGPQFSTVENLSVGMHVDGELFIKVLHKPILPTEQLPSSTVATEATSTPAGDSSQTTETTGTNKTSKRVEEDQKNSAGGVAKNIGFIKLPSRKTSTFADARSSIEQELVPDIIPSGTTWRFFIPGLGPMTLSQEKVMGPMLSFLKQTTSDVNLGNGLASLPLKVFLVDIQTVVSSVSS